MALLKGSQILAKSLIWVQKKIYTFTKQLISPLVNGTFAVWPVLS
jgi:hypothetical protein